MGSGCLCFDLLKIAPGFKTPQGHLFREAFPDLLKIEKCPSSLPLLRAPRKALQLTYPRHSHSGSLPLLTGLWLPGPAGPVGT